MAGCCFVSLFHVAGCPHSHPSLVVACPAPPRLYNTLSAPLARVPQFDVKRSRWGGGGWGGGVGSCGGGSYNCVFAHPTPSAKAAWRWLLCMVPGGEACAPVVPCMVMMGGTSRLLSLAGFSRCCPRGVAEEWGSKGIETACPCFCSLTSLACTLAPTHPHPGTVSCRESPA